MARCKPSTAARIANVWPGMTLATSIQFSRIGRGLPISRPNQFAQVHTRYYHQQLYGTNGYTGTTQLNFFNVGASENITNLNNGLVPDERPFWLTGVCITLQELDNTGANTSVSLGVNTSSVGNTYKVLQSWDSMRAILQGGLFQLRVADRLILDVQDLTHFPSDGGAYVPAIATKDNVAADYGTWGVVNNGEPMAGNRFRLPAPYPILPGKPIAAACKWQKAINVANGSSSALVRVKVELVGESIMPLNG